MSRAPLSLIWILAGCATETSILELEVQLVQEGLSDVGVTVHAAPDGDAIEAAGIGPRTGNRTPGAPRSSAAIEVSVIASGADVERPLRIEVEVCPDRRGGCCPAAGPDCAAPDRHRAVVRVERAFYVGERTRLTLCVAPAAGPGVGLLVGRDPVPLLEGGCAPELALDVGRCAVQGCLEGDDQTHSFCRELTDPTTHYCEPAP